MENEKNEETIQENREKILNEKIVDVVQQNNQKDIKSKKTTKVLTVVMLLVVIALVFVGVLCIEKYKSEKGSNEPSGNVSQSHEDSNESKRKEKKFVFYKDPNSSNIYYEIETENSVLTDNTIVGNYLCYDSLDCKIYSVADNYAVVRDYGNIYIHKLKENKKEKIDLEYNDYSDISVFAYNGELYGLLLKAIDDERYSFYNYEEKKIVIDKEYEFIFDNRFELLEYQNNLSALKQGYIIGRDSQDSSAVEYLIEYKTGKKVLTAKNSYIGVFTNNENTYYYIDNYNAGEIKVYNDELESIASDKKIFKLFVLENGNIIVSDSTTYYLYNKSGALINTSKQYKSVGMVIKDYVVVVDTDNYLKLVDYDDNVVAKFIEMSDNYHFYDYNDTSGWGTNNDKYGVYLYVRNNNVKEETKGYILVYYYIPDTKEQGVFEIEEMPAYGKPVLYLYPENNNTEITVNFEKEYLLTTTYPKFNKSWNVIANKNGDLYDKNGKYYYGLYWEEQGTTDVDFTTGFYVTKDNAISFLEEKLSIIGLNDRERNEFIMYWLPILEKNEKNLIYFELTEERQAYNKLNIIPSPDSLLRVAIHVKKVDKKISIKEEKLIKFNRNGFVAIEWGGVIH